MCVAARPSPVSTASLCAPSGNERDGSNAVGRVRPVRRHRRSRIQEDLSRIAGARSVGRARHARSSASPAAVARSTRFAHGRATASSTTAASTKQAFARLSARIAYIDGDYSDPATYDRLRKALGTATHPLHYLAIPPSMFASGRAGLGAVGLRRRCPRRGGEAVRPRPGVGAGAQRDAARGVSRVDDLPHRPLPRQGGGAEPAVLPLRQRASSSRCGTATTSTACRSRWPRASACRAAALLRGSRRRSATSSRTTCCRSSRCWRWMRRSASDAAGDARREAAAVPRDAAARSGAAWCAASSAATATSRVSPRIRNVETFVALRLQIDTWRWAGVPFYIRAGKCLPMTATEVDRRPEEPAAGDLRRRRRRRSRTISASAWAPKW